MSKYRFFIYKLENHATAVGEYVGPFATERERDEAALRLRNQGGRGARVHSVYRANVEEALADSLAFPDIVAA